MMLADIGNGDVAMVSDGGALIPARPKSEDTVPNHLPIPSAE